ncbi:hypothetical protein DL96DRAFT_1565089 [Flagelloscypha sp. PMI_526]|nr:hypothetical protein DL96DRAFT_1565089 [Flagelloscypha sp. PMI_526]
MSREDAKHWTKAHAQVATREAAIGSQEIGYCWRLLSQLKENDPKMESLPWLALPEEMYDIASHATTGCNKTRQEKEALEKSSLEDKQVARTRPDIGSQPNIHPLHNTLDHRFLFHYPGIHHMRGQTSVIRIRPVESQGPHLVVDASRMEKEKAYEKRKREK